MNKAKYKILIIIFIVLSILLVGTGLVMSIKEEPNNETVNNQEETNSRCVDNVCISKVSVEEVDDSKSINVVLKNESNDIIENLCVNLVAAEKKYVICLNDAAANEELQLNLEYDENAGVSIEDYSLEKASEEDATEANNKRTEVLENIK